MVKLVKKLTLCSFELLRLCVLGLADVSVEIEYTEPPPQDGSTTVEIDYSEPPPPGGSDEMEYFEIKDEDDNVEIEYSEPQDDSDYYEPEWSGEDCSEEELAMANVGRGAGSCNKDCDCPDCAPFCSLKGENITLDML